ncbi:hypothetical protein [Nitrosomonas communis]|uniref:hypothetical protein n=1 Tax=Nitrosomonas communis TaxID=44574 RepID=UPI003D2A640D
MNCARTETQSRESNALAAWLFPVTASGSAALATAVHVALNKNSRRVTDIIFPPYSPIYRNHDAGLFDTIEGWMRSPVSC